MKTLRITLAIVLLLFVAGTYAMNPTTAGPTGHNEPLFGNIKYQVNLHVNPSIGITCDKFFIVLTDENNRIIDKPQHVEWGVTAYYFSETGPVMGTRIARLYESPVGGPVVPFSCDPDVKTGTFHNGVVYIFNLYPKTAPID